MSTAGAQQVNPPGKQPQKPPLKAVPGSGASLKGPKVLRACVVQGGRIVEERRLKHKAPLSLGTSPKNTFVVSDQELPEQHGLFVFRDDHYELIFTDAMQGKVSDSGGSTKTLADLKGSAEKRPNGYAIKLTEKHRGKIALGDITIIFQFVAAPIAGPMTLPKEVKGSFWQQVDWNYAGLLIGIFVFELVAAIGLSFVADPPKEIKLADAGSRFVKAIVPEFEPEEEEVVEEKKTAKNDAKSDEPSKKVKKLEKDSSPKQKAERKQAIRENISNAGLLQVLGTMGGDGAGGAVADVFGTTSIGGDLDSAFAGVEGVGIATQTIEGARGGAAGAKAGIGMGTGEVGDVSSGAKAEKRITGRVKGGNLDVDGELDGDAVAAVVKRRLRAVQSCYEAELKRDPKLSGRVEVEFTIAESGRVESAEVVDDTMGSKAVGSCIVSRIRSWRFPKPDGGSVTVAYPFIFSSSG